MKVLVVLVLAVFTGCNANLLSADEPRATLDDLTDTLEDSLRTVVKPVEDFSDRMWETKIGQDLSARLENGAEMVFSNIQRAEKALGNPLNSVKEQFGLMLYGLAMTVEEKKTTIKKNLEPLAERLAPVAEKVLSEVTQKTQSVRDMAFPYVNKVMERVDSLAQAIPASLDSLYDNPQTTN